VQNLLIDECLSVALVDVARARGHRADHVAYIGWSGIQDWTPMSRIEAGDYLFVTNNRLDFLRLHGKSELHNGLIVIVPNVERAEQVKAVRDGAGCACRLTRPCEQGS